MKKKLFSYILLIGVAVFSCYQFTDPNQQLKPTASRYFHISFDFDFRFEFVLFELCRSN